MKNKMIERIKKLLLKANSTDSVAEAESLFTKASELMIKQKIDQSEIDQQMDESFVDYNEAQVNSIMMEGQWESRLAGAIAKNQDCVSVYDSQRKVVTFYGGDTDVEMAKYFFEQARDTFRVLSRNKYKEHKERVLSENPGMKIAQLEKLKIISYSDTFLRSFLSGCVTGLHTKLVSLKSSTVQKEGTEEYGLMVTNQLRTINQYIAKNLDTRKGSSRGATGDKKAFISGTKSGKKHNLSIGVETDSSSKVGIIS